MIPEFERSARQTPLRPCFIFCDDDGSQTEFDFETLRLEAAALVGAFHERGVQRGDCVSVDMENCPAFVVTILAAAYAGVTLVLLNNRLSEAEKSERIHELKMLPNLHLDVHLDEEYVNDMIGQSNANVWEGIHMAERAGALFDEEASALMLFTSGTSGRAKAVSLSWQNLCGAAHAANITLCGFGDGLWQLALPLFHVGGFEIVTRSIMNEIPFLLYRHFDAERMLDDATRFGVTHVSVVDKMLQDMIASDNGRLKTYECVLLGGAAVNPVSVVSAVACGAQLHVSYGMTETSSLIASSLVTTDHDGSLVLLPGYEAQIISPDEQGVGQLAVRGPGVFARYLNSKAAFTVDGYFLTGDRASMKDGRIKVKERLGDMFVSGGENIYPEEIRAKLLRIPGVKDVYVFGVRDDSWGRRPVALIEKAELEKHDNGLFQESIHAFASRVEEESKTLFSKLYQPRHICVVEAFPRSGIGKVDRIRLRELYDQRIEVQDIKFHRLEQRLTKPFVTAQTEMETRESVIIEVIDHKGRVGLGECVAFPTDWYLPETLDYDMQVIKERLAPLVQGKVFLHPREVSGYLSEYGDISAPMAYGALEPAFWDLYGKICEKPFWQLLQEEFSGSTPRTDPTIQVSPGLVLGIMSIDQTLSTLRDELNAGYDRVKLKIKPGDDYERVRAVREAFPDLKILLDANQSYTEEDIETLKKLDSFDIICIEEPLAPDLENRAENNEFFTRLSKLQSQITTPICLDESILRIEDAYRALLTPGLRCFALKIGKWGGISPSLDFCRAAHRAGARVWMGGMYETAVSKRFHAAFQTLPTIDIPGDLSSTDRYFTTEITRPRFEVKEGAITLNEPGYEYGIGCELDYGVIDQLIRETSP